MLEKSYNRKKTNGGYWHYEGLSWAAGGGVDVLLEMSGYGRQCGSSVGSGRMEVDQNEPF